MGNNNEENFVSDIVRCNNCGKEITMAETWNIDEMHLCEECASELFD